MFLSPQEAFIDYANALSAGSFEFSNFCTQSLNSAPVRYIVAHWPSAQYCSLFGPFN